MGFILRFVAIALLIGFTYVSIKRVLFPKRPKPPVEPAVGSLPVADDLVKCPRCGVYGVAGQICATPSCSAAKESSPHL